MIDVVPLEVARVDLGLTVFELWVAYFALGGVRSVVGLGSYLSFGGASSEADHDAIVHALNEAYDDRGQDRTTVAYAQG
jgi:hypothetical protein